MNNIFSKLLKIFPALYSKNFRLYFYGQLISLIGTWLQTVAQAWLVLLLTHSAFWVGTVTALQYAPTFLLSLFGGVLVDRNDTKKILFATQSTAMILAFVLGALTITNNISLVNVIIFAVLLGIVNALDMPARQAFVAELAPKEHYASAFALNSALSNGARVIGPAIAGLMIAAIGTGGTFIVNGASFIAVIIALFLIKTEAWPEISHPHPITMIKEGLRYTFQNKTLKFFMIISGITAVLGWSYTAMLPIFADSIFNRGAAGLGYLYGAAGLGAATAAVFVSGFSHKERSGFFITGGSFMLALGLIFFSLTKNFDLGLAALFMAGSGFTAEFSMISALIQKMISNEMRGRVISILTLMFLGASPLGNFSIGLLSEHAGPQAAVFYFGIAMLLVSTILVLNNSLKKLNL